VSSIRDDYDRAIKLYNAGDLDGLANVYAEDAVLMTPDGTAKGRAAIRAQWAREKVGCPDRTVTPDLVFEQGDMIVTEFTWVATLTGPWVLPDGTELPPTGKRMELRGMDLTQLRDGKVVVHRMYWDNMEGARQAGLLP
jgi:ketosteroid isomerase-like protein